MLTTPTSWLRFLPAALFLATLAVCGVTAAVSITIADEILGEDNDEGVQPDPGGAAAGPLAVQQDGDAEQDNADAEDPQPDPEGADVEGPELEVQPAADAPPAAFEPATDFERRLLTHGLAIRAAGDEAILDPAMPEHRQVLEMLERHDQAQERIELARRAARSRARAANRGARTFATAARPLPAPRAPPQYDQIPVELESTLEDQINNAVDTAVNLAVSIGPDTGGGADGVAAGRNNLEGFIERAGDRLTADEADGILARYDEAIGNAFRNGAYGRLPARPPVTAVYGPAPPPPPREAFYGPFAHLAGTDSEDSAAAAATSSSVSVTDEELAQAARAALRYLESLE